jgi:hypothetical protein
MVSVLRLKDTVNIPKPNKQKTVAPTVAPKMDF